MARKQSRVNPAYMASQETIRKSIKDAPGQAGGLPELKDRVEAIEEVLSLRIHAT